MKVLGYIAMDDNGKVIDNQITNKGLATVKKNKHKNKQKAVDMQRKKERRAKNQQRLLDSCLKSLMNHPNNGSRR